MHSPRPRGGRLPDPLWTCRRIVQLVRERFGESCHPDHIGRLLRACGLTPQRPQRIAQERDDQRVRHWLQKEWPRVKKLRRRGARLVCLDETGFLLTPLLRRTWGLRGVTPTLAVRARHHEKVSGLGPLAVSPRRRGVTLALAKRAGALIYASEEALRHACPPGQPHAHTAGPLDVRQWLEGVRPEDFEE